MEYDYIRLWIMIFIFVKEGTPRGHPAHPTPMTHLLIAANTRHCPLGDHDKWFMSRVLTVCSRSGVAPLMILIPYRLSLMRGEIPYSTASLSPWGSTAKAITGSVREKGEKGKGRER